MFVVQFQYEEKRLVYLNTIIRPKIVSYQKAQVNSRLYFQTFYPRTHTALFTANTHTPIKTGTQTISEKHKIIYNFLCNTIYFSFLFEIY